MAYEIGYDLVAETEDLEACRKAYEERAGALEKVLAEYLNTMKRIKENAIRSGETHQRLTVFLEYAGLLQTETYRMAGVMKQGMEGYLSAMETEDTCTL